MPKNTKSKSIKGRIEHARQRATSVITGTGVPLIDAADNQCRFIAGDARSLLICGDPVVLGSPYCPIHHSRCWNG